MVLLYVERDDHEPILVDATLEVVVPILAEWQKVDGRYGDSLIEDSVDASDWCGVEEFLMRRGIGIIAAPALYLDDIEVAVSTEIAPIAFGRVGA